LYHEKVIQGEFWNEMKWNESLFFT
jgi:hypothetical protein